MKLEQQVTSLELSKKLKELGVKQKSLFYWINTGDSPDEGYRITETENAHVVHQGLSTAWVDEPDTYSAFTIAELGEMLPNHFYKIFKASDEFAMGNQIDYHNKKIKMEITYHKGNYGNWVCLAESSIEYNLGEREVHLGKTLAECMAKMLIYLLENNLLEH